MLRPRLAFLSLALWGKELKETCDLCECFDAEDLREACEAREDAFDALLDALDLADFDLDALRFVSSFEEELLLFRTSFKYFSISSGCCVVR